MKPVRTVSPGQAQRGAATLVVVMILFLVMALLAAYANRSLVFEQRISGSYYRASIAQELAEGGVDWTVAMLNGDALDANCLPEPMGGQRFIDKYMTVSTDDRLIQPTMAAGTDPALDVAVDCAKTDNNTLVCRCPARGPRTAQPATASADNLVPTFGVILGYKYTDQHYGNFTVASTGCASSSIDDCLAVETLSQQGTAMAMQTSSIAFISALPSSPASPLTVRGTLTTAGAGGLGLHNTDPRSAGTLVISGGDPAALDDSRMDSMPGTPASQARIFNEPTLFNAVLQADQDRVFQIFLGMAPSRYKQHPALKVVSCASTTDCGPDLMNAYNAGRRMLWVDGDMTIGSNIVLGTVDAPVVIVATGNVTLQGAMQLTGLLVAQGNLAWNNVTGTPSRVVGSVLVVGNMATNGFMDIQYQQAVLDQLRNRQGSYARVQGGWINTNR